MRKKLYITHNISEDGLLFSKEIGGIVNPSLAIHCNNKMLTGFGEITLIKRPDSFKMSQHNVFNADVYSARIPNIFYDLEGYILEGINELFEISAKKYGIPTTGIRYPYNENGDNSLLESGMLNIANNLKEDVAMMLIYANENNINISIKKKDLESPIKLFSISDFKKISGKSKESTNKEMIDFCSDLIIKKIEKQAIKNIKEHPLKEGEDYQKEFDFLCDDLKSMYLNKEGLIKNIFLNKVLSFSKDIDKNEKKVDLDHLKKSLISKIHKNPKKSKEYKDWILKEFKHTLKNPYFLVSSKNSWDNKKKDATIENMSKEMNKEIRDSEKGAFKSGAGSLRATVCKNFRRMKEIEKDIDKLVTHEEFKEISRKSTEKTINLISELESFFKFSAKGFYYHDAALEALKKYAKSSRKEYITESYDFLGEDDKYFEKIDDLLIELKNMEAPYFEAKSKVIYSISDFSTALVPKGTSKEVIDLLKENKLKIVEFNPESDISIISAINKDQSLLFGDGGEFDFSISDNSKDNELSL